MMFRQLVFPKKSQVRDQREIEVCREELGQVIENLEFCFSSDFFTYSSKKNPLG